jgi:hypothetical protein
MKYKELFRLYRYHKDVLEIISKNPFFGTFFTELNKRNRQITRLSPISIDAGPVLFYQNELLKRENRLKRFEELSAPEKYIKREKEMIEDSKWLLAEAKDAFKQITNEEWDKVSCGDIILSNKEARKVLANNKPTKEFKEHQRRLVNLSVRFRVFKRDKFTCIYCGQKSPNVVLELDHRTPVVKGGESKEDNLVTACFECNRGKKDSIV